MYVARVYQSNTTQSVSVFFRVFDLFIYIYNN